jgi:hypothetical protein
MCEPMPLMIVDRLALHSVKNPSYNTASREMICFLSAVIAIFNLAEQEIRHQRYSRRDDYF